MVGEMLGGGGESNDTSGWYEPFHEGEEAGRPIDDEGSRSGGQAASGEGESGEKLEQDGFDEVRESDGPTGEGSAQDGSVAGEGEGSTGEQLKGDVEGNKGGGGENRPEERGTVRTEASLEEARKALATADGELAKANEALEKVNGEMARLQDELKTLEGDIATNVENQSKYESTIMQCETAIRTARSQLIGDLSDMIKFLVVHREEESGDSLSRITSTLKSITESKKRLKETKGKIAEGKEAKRRLLEQRQNTIGNMAQTRKSLPSLERRVDKLSAQKEKTEARVKHWEKVRDWDIKSEDARGEMRGRSLLGFKIEMERRRREVEKEYLDRKAKLESRTANAEMVRFFQDSGLLKANSTEEAWEKVKQYNKDQLEEAEEAYMAQLAEIEKKIAKVEQYRPTWLNRIQFIYGNPDTKKALNNTKRRVLGRPAVGGNGDGGASWEQPMPMAV